MLADQKKLLAQLRGAETAAVALYDSGAKIIGVLRQIRGAADDLDARIRFIERHAEPAPKAPKPKAEPKDSPAGQRP